MALEKSEAASKINPVEPLFKQLPTYCWPNQIHDIRRYFPMLTLFHLSLLPKSPTTDEKRTYYHIQGSCKRFPLYNIHTQLMRQRYIAYESNCIFLVVFSEPLWKMRRVVEMARGTSELIMYGVNICLLRKNVKKELEVDWDAQTMENVETGRQMSPIE